MDKQVEESYDKLDHMNVIHENEEEIKELWKEKCEISIVKSVKKMKEEKRNHYSLQHKLKCREKMDSLSCLWVRGWNP